MVKPTELKFFGSPLVTCHSPLMSSDAALAPSGFTGSVFTPVPEKMEKASGNSANSVQITINTAKMVIMSLRL